MVERGYIDKDNKKYLQGWYPKLGRFYLLPEIHKRLENVPGRPVISYCGTATERISEFLDFHIQPLVVKVPSIIRDTTDFLCKLKGLGFIPKTAILCTVDVVGLYPHIPHEEGLEALRKVLTSDVGQELADDLIKSARFVLENNYFEFERKIYRQKLGTAIGTKLAPGFANILTDDWEKNFLSSCRFCPWVWFRFLDDIFWIWLHGPQELESILGKLNSYHETIKFTWENSKEKIFYLDVMVSLEDGKLSTDVYHKPTNAHQYVNFRSCHPLHVNSISESSSGYYEMITSQLTYTAEVN